MLCAAWERYNDNFQRANTGKDLVIGHGNRDTVRCKYAAQFGDATSMKETNTFKQFVTLKGGEYFFAPSMDFFNSL